MAAGVIRARVSGKSRETGWYRDDSSLSVELRDFLFYRKFFRIPYKIKNNYRAAAEKKYAAKATRRRRRILQSRILCPLWEIAFCKVKCGNAISGGQLIEIRKKRREEYEREAERHRRKRGGAD